MHRLCVYLTEMDHLLWLHSHRSGGINAKTCVFVWVSNSLIECVRLCVCTLTAEQKVYGSVTSCWQFHIHSGATVRLYWRKIKAAMKCWAEGEWKNTLWRLPKESPMPFTWISLYMHVCVWPFIFYLPVSSHHSCTYQLCCCQNIVIHMHKFQALCLMCEHV